VGSVVFSSGITGAGPDTGKLPEDVREQVRLMFKNLRSFLDAAGVTTDDAVRVQRRSEALRRRR
jgi:enamine deaminase RidA (YjgF/YER057c/UK114 family)